VATATIEAGRLATAEYALALGDDALMASHRLSEWLAWAPELEEEMALANIALDLLGHARTLLGYAGEAMGVSEDQLAYFRDEAQFRCLHLVQAPRGDFAVTTARGLILATYWSELYDRLAGSADPLLAALAAKARKEVAYHATYFAGWWDRLALGTDQSRAKLVDALRGVWAYLPELFAPFPGATQAPPGVAVDPADLRQPVMERLAAALARVGLDAPDVPGQRGGGRLGQHSEHLGLALAEMQWLARRHPGAEW
jgi:ring-1,2-phenylacetyl-CoA epoxidase subunit PaaC